MRRTFGFAVVSVLSVSGWAHAQASFPDAAPPGAPPPAAAPAPAPPPAAAPAPAPPPAAAPPAAAPAPAPVIAEPPLPPPLPTNRGPIREARPFFIGGELGWNGLAGFGVNFSYHPIPYLAIDSGLGLALTGFRLGIRARANFLKGEWTPIVGAGFTHSGGIPEAEVESKGEKVKLEVLTSSYVQAVAGVNYTGSEGFVFMGTLGYAFLLQKNTRYISGSEDAYSDVKPIYGGGTVISVAFGYAF